MTEIIVAQLARELANDLLLHDDRASDVFDYKAMIDEILAAALQ